MERRDGFLATWGGIEGIGMIEFNTDDWFDSEPLLRRALPVRTLRPFD
jgi:hypothetical protein